jgi:hypothetical protein
MDRTKQPGYASRFKLVPPHRSVFCVVQPL